MVKTTDLTMDQIDTALAKNGYTCTRSDVVVQSFLSARLSRNGPRSQGFASPTFGTPLTSAGRSKRCLRVGRERPGPNDEALSVTFANLVRAVLLRHARVRCARARSLRQCHSRRRNQQSPTILPLGPSSCPPREFRRSYRPCGSPQPSPFPARRRGDAFGEAGIATPYVAMTAEEHWSCQSYY